MKKFKKLFSIFLALFALFALASSVPVFAAIPTPVQDIANNIKATAMTHDQVQISPISFTLTTAGDSSTIYNNNTNTTLMVFQFYDSPMSYITSNIGPIQAAEVPYTITMTSGPNAVTPHFIFV